MRTKWLIAILAAAAAPAAAPSAAALQTQRVQAVDWTRTVSMTPEGGFRMGNPKARVALVEFGSLTCPHCAHFMKSGVPSLLAKYVKSGKVSFEFRNFVLNGVDVTASLLARCSGPQNFFRVVDGMYQSQERWMSKVTGMTQAQKDELKGLSQPDQLARIAQISGLADLAAGGGVTPARAKQCLADKAGLDRLVQMYEAGGKLGITGTPSFLINGTLVEARDWAGLEPLIRKAGG